VDYTVYELPFETALPAAGRLSSSFGYRIHPIYGDWRFHYGVDIANSAGTPIVAFADGTVTAAGTSNGYGNYVILEHDGGFFTLYAHCRTVNVKAGQTVKRGQKIAAIGSTGVTTGPHLHFELRYGDAFLDPAGYLDV
jgi:murein DD-endopeptidase MepM/ murein hydrolase activator NlpD